MQIRIHFSKTREGRFLSHLDLMHTWERTIRRSRLPLAYSKGFHPHPQISFGSALAVGTTSDGEYMDMELVAEMPLAQVEAALVHALPPAIAIHRMRIMEGKQNSLMSIINRGRYTLKIAFAGDGACQENLEQAIDTIMACEEVTVLRFKKNSREKRPVNIRPGLYQIQGKVQGQEGIVQLEIQTGSEGNVRPEEVIYGLMTSGLAPVQDILHIHRNGLYLALEDGGLITPLEV